MYTKRTTFSRVGWKIAKVTVLNYDELEHEKFYVGMIHILDGL